jgi:hypothetical protein
MLEIQDAMYDRAKDDATLQGKTGYAAANPRIYWLHPPSTPLVNDTYPAYIIMYSYFSGGARAIGASAWPNRVFSLEVRSASPTTNADIVDRLIELFDEYRFTTTNHPSSMWVQLLAFRELGMDSSTYHFRTLVEFEVSNITDS